MRSRVAAGATLAGSVALAGLAVASPTIALAIVVAVGLSAGYVAYLAWRGWQVMRAALRAAPADLALAGAEGDPPFVSLVVPARDEAPVIEAVMRDLAGQVYHLRGEPRFEVVVVDDGSADGTGEIARRVAADYGDRLRVARRDPGSGPATRGAALEHAMPYARGEVIAAIDADARLAPDFLARAMRAWRRDPQAAALQALRRPTNADRSWLTAAQGEELLIDMASQCGRWAVGGTAELRGNGMLVRRDVLERLGGWGRAALTEDLDLSTRLAAAGERVTLAPEATVGEEAVEAPRALWPQRLRWAEGSARRLIEHGSALLGGPLPLGPKLDFASFLAEFAVPPLMVASLAAAAVSQLLGGTPPTPAGWAVPLLLAAGYGAGTLLLALAGLAADGRRGLPLAAGALRGVLFLSLWLIVVPAALGRIAFGAAEPRYVKTPRVGHRPALR